VVGGGWWVVVRGGKTGVCVHFFLLHPSILNSHLPHADDRVQRQDEQDDARLHKGGDAFLGGRAVDEGQAKGDGGGGEEDLWFFLVGGGGGGERLSAPRARASAAGGDRRRKKEAGPGGRRPLLTPFCSRHAGHARTPRLAQGSTHEHGQARRQGSGPEKTLEAAGGRQWGDGHRASARRRRPSSTRTGRPRPIPCPPTQKTRQPTLTSMSSNWARTSLHIGVGGSRASSLGPCSARRRPASASVRPDAGSEPAAAAAAAAGTAHGGKGAERGGIWVSVFFLFCFSSCEKEKKERSREQAPRAHTGQKKSQRLQKGDRHHAHPAHKPAHLAHSAASRGPGAYTPSPGAPGFCSCVRAPDARLAPPPLLSSPSSSHGRPAARPGAARPADHPD
jgi:hypothetical protein